MRFGVVPWPSSKNFWVTSIDSTYGGYAVGRRHALCVPFGGGESPLGEQWIAGDICVSPTAGFLRCKEWCGPNRTDVNFLWIRGLVLRFGAEGLKRLLARCVGLLPLQRVYR
jgi:hypothetical protein